jgi:hypothetical protein
MAKNKGPVHTTPFGVAVYPRLNRPDTKFDDLGAYKADVRIPLADARGLMTQLSKYYTDHVGKKPNATDNTMWTQETDEEGDKTGFVLFKLRVKNKMRRDGELWDRKPKLFDASGRPCPSVNPWGGSVIAVNFEVYCWDTGSKAGVSLQPMAVQIKELVQGGDSDDASGYGFGKEEGFNAEDAMPSGDDEGYGDMDHGSSSFDEEDF